MTVVFATYQSIAVLTAAQESGVGAFDLIICDEAHRTTGVSTGDDDSAFVRVHEDRHVRGAKRLYMTATPRIYGEAARQRAAEQSITLAQMDDPAIYGETLFERGFSWAVENDLLTDYRVIVLAVDEGLVARSVQRRLAQDNELRLDDATKIIGCFKALAKLDIAADVGADVQPMNRALAFCRDIKSSKIIEAEFAAVVDEYRAQAGAEEAMADLRCAVRHVDGTFNAESRSRLLDWLKTGEDGAYPARPPRRRRPAARHRGTHRRAQPLSRRSRRPHGDRAARGGPKAPLRGASQPSQQIRGLRCSTPQPRPRSRSTTSSQTSSLTRRPTSSTCSTTVGAIRATPSASRVGR
jgi:hypothetical protein